MSQHASTSQSTAKMPSSTYEQDLVTKTPPRDEDNEAIDGNVTRRSKNKGVAKNNNKRQYATMTRPTLKSYKSEILQSHWETMFNHLKQYKSVHGNCLVPHRYSEYPALGAWVSTQRRQYKVGKEGRAWTGKANSTPLDPSRCARLEAIGFVWSSDSTLKIPWERRFQEFVTFHQVHGHCRVPSNYKASPRLGHWVKTQRHDAKLMKRGHSSRMSSERLQALEAVGFFWDATKVGEIKSLHLEARLEGDSETDSDSNSTDKGTQELSSDIAVPPERSLCLVAKNSLNCSIPAQVQSNQNFSTNNNAGCAPIVTRGADLSMMQEDSQFLQFPLSEFSAAASRLRIASAGQQQENFAHPNFGPFDPAMHAHVAAARQQLLASSMFNQAFAASFGRIGGFLGGHLGGDHQSFNQTPTLLHQFRTMGPTELALVRSNLWPPL